MNANSPESTWAARLAPHAELLAENALIADRERRLPDSTIDVLSKIGAFSILTPAENGGTGGGALELITAATAIGYHCPAAAWVTVISNGSALLLSRFSPGVRKRVYTSDAPVPLASVFVSPGGGAVRDGDQYRVDGRWPFASNVIHAEWSLVILPVRESEEAEPSLGFALLHRDQYSIEDTWQTIGMRGTGSNTIVASDQRVPADQVLSIEAILGPTLADSESAGLVQRLAPPATMAAAIAAPALGATQAALDYVRAKSVTRRTTNSSYATQAQSGAFVYELGQASTIIESIELHLQHAARAVDAAAHDARSLTEHERGACWAHASRAATLSVEALTRLTSLHGTASFSATGVRLVAWCHFPRGSRRRR